MCKLQIVSCLKCTGDEYLTGANQVFPKDFTVFTVISQINAGATENSW